MSITQDPKFWDRVQKTDNCWSWTGAKTTKGFGRYKTSEGFKTPHRLTYEEYVGPIGKATPIVQTCGNQLCVRPEHLEIKSVHVADWTDRFWEKVDKTDDHWLWNSFKDDKGYGRFNIKGTPRLAHRLSYSLLVGEIPDGLGLDHRCNTPACVRPEHLRPATQKQNVENQARPPAHNKSGVIGVSWSKVTGKWLARTYHHGKAHDFGYHVTIEAAAEAVQEGRNKLFTHNDRDR